MDEQAWLTSPEALSMLLHLGQQADRRKLRLFAVACCRAVLHHVAGDVERKAVDAIEAYADGKASMTELHALSFSVVRQSGAIGEGPFWIPHAVSEACDRLAWKAARMAKLMTADAEGDMAREQPAWVRCRDQYLSHLGAAVAQHATVAFVMTMRAQADARQADFLRCIFGNPFKQLALDPAWRTATVLGLARTIYDDRHHDRMPLLGDALEDAGCADQAVLDHCRSLTPHVRGCFVVDVIRGKEVTRKRRRVGAQKAAVMATV